MHISAKLAVWMCAVFGLVCLGGAISAFTGASSLTDPAEREASFGYAAFWGFLALVAAVFGVLSWMIAKGKLGRAE
jgi:dipeptide/tripeptide permease